MSVFSKTKILKRMELEVSEPESLVITPFNENLLDADSVDLRLGSHFLFPKVTAKRVVEVGNSNPGEEFSVHVLPGEELILPAHETVLGVTLEFIKMPFDVSGQILTKSSVARAFMVIETAPWIHPNYRDCLTLEIANVSNSAIKLRPGMRIGQLILFAVDLPEKSNTLSGSYVGPIYPEAPGRYKRHPH